MTTENQPKMMEVDLPNGKISLPEEAAKLVIAGRDLLKAEARGFADKIGAFEQEKQAAQAAVAKAEEDKRLAEAMKAGELEKVREISESKLSKVATKFRDKALESIVSKHPGINPDFVIDVSKNIAMHCTYDLDADALKVFDGAGKPVLSGDGTAIGADAFVAKFLTDNPKYLLAKAPPGSGAAGSKSGVAGETMTSAAFNAESFSPKQRSEFMGRGGIVVG